MKEAKKMLDVGLRIHELRRKRKMTLKELGEKVGLTHATVSRYERGYIGQITTEKLKEFADALGTSAAYLIGWTDIEDAEEYENSISLKEQIKEIVVDNSLSTNDLENILNYAKYVVSQRKSK